MPGRPFIMKSNQSIYRYGIRYNVVTDTKGKTELIDLCALSNTANRDNVADDIHIRQVELIRVGKNNFVVVNGKRYSIKEILTTENSV